MRILAPLVLLLASGLLVLTSRGADAPDRPPGIDAQHWVSLGTSIGLVLSSDENAPQIDNANQRKSDQPGTVYPQVDRTALFGPTSPVLQAALKHAEAQEPVHGYLMVKQDGIWRRLLVSTP